MTETERVLLDNALDALDRLFDSKSEVVDAYFLIYATAQALTESRFFRDFDEAARQLKTTLRSDLSRIAARDRALVETDKLRKVIAAAFPAP